MSRSGSGVLARLRRCRRGASAVEFALVGGLLVMLIIAAVQTGRLMLARSAVSHALSDVTRTVLIRPTTTAAEIIAALEERLDDIADRQLAVAVTQVAGTSFMRIEVVFPFEFSIPLLPTRELTLRVRTLAPMVSPVQQG